MSKQYFWIRRILTHLVFLLSGVTCTEFRFLNSSPSLPPSHDRQPNRWYLPRIVSDLIDFDGTGIDKRDFNGMDSLYLDENDSSGIQNWRDLFPHDVQIGKGVELWKPSSSRIMKMSNLQQQQKILSSWKWDALKLSITLPNPPRYHFLDLWKSTITSRQRIELQEAKVQSTLLNEQEGPLLRSTGTTIVGLVLADKTVILGADTRATDGRIVADKSCSKIHPLTSHDHDVTCTTILTTTMKDIQNTVQQDLQRQSTALETSNSLSIYACGAGTSGDLEALARLVRFTLRQLHSHQSSIGNHPNTQPKSKKAELVHYVCSLVQQHLYEAQGSLGVNWILGAEGGTLVAIHPHGSFESLPYAALGSGGPAGLAVLESSYDPSLSLLDAVQLVVRAVQAGIDNDLGSGSQVDLCILYSNGRVLYVRVANDKPNIPTSIPFRIDNTDDYCGANGFGNVPYRKESRRILRPPLKLENDSRID
jgi:20S proteasome subunit beta 2